MNLLQYNLLVRMLISVPLLVLLIAYGAIAMYTDNLWPWLEFVHESGDRTLLDTVLYFDHAARELPLDIVLGVAVGGSVFYVLPAQFSNSGANSRWMARTMLLAVVVVCSVIVVGTIDIGGLELLSDNLSQKPTRPGESLMWGAHWRYHLLSRLSLILGSIGFAAVITIATKGLHGKGHRTGALVFNFAFATFLALSILFNANPDPFVDPVYLGHQVREVFTHGLVTVPLAWGLCLSLSDRSYSLSAVATVETKFAVLGGFLAVLIVIFLVASGVSVSAASHGQSQSIILLIGPHFFEHSFTYVVVPIVAATTYQFATAMRQQVNTS